MTTQAWDVYLGNPGPPPGLLAELSRLRTALPRYDVIVTGHSLTYRFEAIRRHGGPGPWCVISSDPGDLWRELAPLARRGTDTGSPARAP
jgi:hypothetical protein